MLKAGMGLRDEVQELLRSNRWGAHQALFGHRHEDAPALWHRELVDDFWSAAERLVILGFRGGGKSTCAEEYLALAARENLFKVGLIVGPSETRAAEHLGSVIVELKQNDLLAEVFGGPAVFTVDQATKISLRDGPTVMAIGRGQDIRGLKQVSDRPDLVVVEDFEDAENVLTPEGRRRMLRWFLRELRLACSPRARLRVLATIMDRDCVPLQLGRAGWPLKRYPVAYRDETGQLAASWPARYPLDWIERERAEYQRHGEAGIWEMEMMCEEGSVAGEADFRPEYFHVKPREHSWEPVYAMVDPARTARGEGSATGIVVFSWVGHDLVVWEDRTGFYRPSEIIDIMFDLDERYHPVTIGFEEVGLEDWAMEPIRAEMLRRGRHLPLLGLRAPRDKLGFIRGLEPHARAGEISFAQPMPDLVGAFVGFPRGRIDGPNALAYAKTMRPGIPVYEHFRPEIHVAERVYCPKGEPLYLALNASNALLTGVLAGHSGGRTVISADWIREGDAGAVAEAVVREAAMIASGRLEVVCGPRHFDQWHNVGLVQALRTVPIEVRTGGNERDGREFLRRELVQVARDYPAVQVAASARWTAAALSSGYARKPGKDEPEMGPYRLLAEGLESWLGLLAWGLEDADAPAGNWAYDAAGRRYRSILPEGRGWVTRQ